MSPGELRQKAVSAARILGVDPEIDPEGLKRAFRAAVKAAHPDRPGGDAERLRMVIEAFEWLSAHPATKPAFVGERPEPPPILEITPVQALCGGRQRTRTWDGREIYVSLPPGLRAGDPVRIAGRMMNIAITSSDGAAVIGDHLCLSANVDPQVLRLGGTIIVETPLGPHSLRVTRQDGIRGLVRVAGKGLPPRAGRPRGDLLLRLWPVASSQTEPSEAQTKRRQFMADWAA